MFKLEVQVVVNKPKTDSQSNTVGWDDINWRKVERAVFKLQKRIYAASRRGDIKQVRKLQKIITGYLLPGKGKRTPFGYLLILTSAVAVQNMSRLKAINLLLMEIQFIGVQD
jgi:N-terminal domain of reverse transcriptase